MHNSNKLFLHFTQFLIWKWQKYKYKSEKTQKIIFLKHNSPLPIASNLLAFNFRPTKRAVKI
jgi:hypothetical protein